MMWNNSNKDNYMMHYCGPESFFNILNTKSLWLSNVMNLRDPSERKSLLSKFKHQMEIEFKEEKYRLLQEDISLFINARNDYVVCFSDIDKNLELLDQWRIYASDAEGIAIWFNPEKLCSYHYDPFSSESRTSDVFLSNVKYGENYEGTAVHEAISEIKLIAESYDDTRSKEVIERVQLIVQRLGDKSIVCKNECYSSECEVRLIYSNCGFDIGIEHRFELKNVFTCVNGVISSRYIYHFNVESYRGVGVGPRCKSNQYDVINYAKAMMGAHHGHCQFWKCILPYR